MATTNDRCGVPLCTPVSKLQPVTCHRWRASISVTNVRHTSTCIHIPAALSHGAIL